jgi:hypothetical protein
MAIAFCFNRSSTAQNTITFKGQVLNTKFGMQKRITLLVNSRFVMTNDSGFFQVTLPKTNTHLQVSIPFSEYLVLYPSGGYVSIPRDLKDIPLIILGSPTDMIPFKQYLEMYSLSNAATAEVRPAIRTKLDSLKKVLLRFRVTQAEITKAEKEAEEKDAYLSALCGDVLKFRNKVFELKTNFKWLANKSLEDGDALQALIRSANEYDSTYQKFDRQHAVYENMKFQYWRNEDLLPAVRQYSDFVVLRIHADGIYPMQELILQIKQYFSGKKKNKALKKSIGDKILKHYHAIEKLLPEIDRKTKEIIIAAGAV